MNNNPLVSIVIPVYNGENYLKEAIDSALSQTYKNIEVLVVDDGSIDSTPNIALSYGNRIRYFRKENGGVSSALNLGIQHMKGDYFSWLSHDDKYFPNKIMCQIDSLNCFNAENAVVFSNVVQINKSGEIIKKRKKNKYLKYARVNKWDESLFALMKSGSYNGCALLIPKTALEEAKGFDESLRYCQDFLMWAQVLMNKHPIVYCPEYCTMNRVHNKQLTQSGTALLHSDTKKMTVMLYDSLKANSKDHNNFVFEYACYCAKYNCRDSCNYILEKSKNDNVLSFFEIIRIKFLLGYGSIRPFFRRLYYRLFKKVSVKK